MNLKKENRSGSKWRRSLMALAVLSAPVVSIAGFGGTVSATPTPVTTSSNCASNSATLSVTITNSISNQTFWQVTIAGVIVPQTQQGNPDYKPGSAAGGQNPVGQPLTLSTTLINPDDGDFPYEVRQYSKSGSDYIEVTANRASGNIKLDCNFNFDVNDAFDVVTNCSPSAGITVTVFSKNKNAPYTLVVDVPDNATLEVPFQLADFLTDDGGTPKVYSGSKTFSNGQGVYVVSVVHNQSEKTLKLKNVEQTGTYTVNCTSTPPTSGPGGGGGYNFTFNLPKVTTPTLPSTGSDSSTSLLVIAPVMMLLGAGLIMARRRTSTV